MIVMRRIIRSRGGDCEGIEARDRESERARGRDWGVLWGMLFGCLFGGLFVRGFGEGEVALDLVLEEADPLLPFDLHFGDFEAAHGIGDFGGLVGLHDGGEEVFADEDEAFHGVALFDELGVGAAGTDFVELTSAAGVFLEGVLHHGADDDEEAVAVVGVQGIRILGDDAEALVVGADGGDFGVAGVEAGAVFEQIEEEAGVGGAIGDVLDVAVVEGGVDGFEGVAGFFLAAGIAEGSEGFGPGVAAGGCDLGTEAAQADGGGSADGDAVIAEGFDEHWAGFGRIEYVGDGEQAGSGDELGPADGGRKRFEGYFGEGVLEGVGASVGGEQLVAGPASGGVLVGDDGADMLGDELADGGAVLVVEV